MVQPNPSVVSDFSNLPPYYGSSPFGSAYVLMGDRYEQAPTLTSIYHVNPDDMPQTFPLQQWYDQSGRYNAYWAWFNGDVLNQSRQNGDGELEYRFPLRINSLRDIVRKNTSVLFGEVADGPEPLVTTSVRARKGLTDEPASESQHKFAKLCENIVNEVWMQSNGRSIQQEGGELSQFLGGHVYQLAYESWRNDVDIPIFIRSWKADLFLPVWKNGNYWDLSEAFVVTRLESAVAQSSYGVESNGAFVFYVEHWTTTSYSIYVDGKPITMMVDGKSVTFSNLTNPFGFVPFFYIPHLREGSFFGTSHIPDLVGLIEEYNAAMANLGDAIQDSVERERYIRNSPTRTPVTLPNGKKATNLGVSNPAAHDPPDAFVEDPPQISPGLSDYVDKVYKQIRRAGFLPAVAEGEDEGSQRSGVTLDIRFWPATAHAKMERGYWETGLNLMAKRILQMVDNKKLWPKGTEKPDIRFLTRLSIVQEWSPMIPRDRVAEVNEFLSRLRDGGMSLKKFLQSIGDVENEDEEEALIREWLTFKASLDIKAQPGQQDPLKNSYSKQNKAIDND